MQLREVVDSVTADEPPLVASVDDIVFAGRKAERRRKTGFATAGAAGLVAVAVAGAFALPHGGQGGTPATGGEGAQGKASSAAAPTWSVTTPFTFTFRGYDAGKLHVQDPTDVTGAYQVAEVRVDGANKERTDKYASLMVFRPGAFDVSSFQGTKTVTVDGTKVLELTSEANHPGDKSIAWQYTSGAWAVVRSFSDSASDPSDTDLTALVAGLKPSSPTAVVLPFTVGYVPAGYTVVDAAQHSGTGFDSMGGGNGSTYGGALFAKKAPATGLSYPYEEKDVPGSFSITVSSLSATGQSAQGKDQLTKCFDLAKAHCDLALFKGDTQITVGDRGKLSLAEKTKIANSVTLADVTDDTTWTTAAKAVQQ